MGVGFTDGESSINFPLLRVRQLEWLILFDRTVPNCIRKFNSLGNGHLKNIGG